MTDEENPPSRRLWGQHGMRISPNPQLLCMIGEGSAYSMEFCHLIRRKVATQSTPKLPCNPSESCRLIRRKVATYSGAKLPPPSERRDATCFMGNLISPGLSMPLHLEYLPMRTDAWGCRVQAGAAPGLFVPLVALRSAPLRGGCRSGFGSLCPSPPFCAPAPPTLAATTETDAGAQSRALVS